MTFMPVIMIIFFIRIDSEITEILALNQTLSILTDNTMVTTTEFVSALHLDVKLSALFMMSGE